MPARPGAFHDPAVATQALATLNAAATDPGLDATFPAFLPTAAMIVALGRRAAWRVALARADRRHSYAACGYGRPTVPISPAATIRTKP